MMSQISSRLLSLLSAVLIWSHVAAAAGLSPQVSELDPGGDEEIAWAGTDASGSLQIHLYFFWSQGCPHCARARPFVESLAGRTPWLNLHSLSLNNNKRHIAQYLAMADSVGEEPGGVPAFVFCGTMLVGYDDDATTGDFLESKLNECRRYLLESNNLASPKMLQGPAPAPLNIPVFGEIDAQALSLPMLTLVLAGLDSFNPCAFFVLLFLLSLLVHARSRARMLAIGGIFVFTSGLIYFLFMTAWLNLFLVIGQIQWITMIAGIVAVAIATFNIKDYFWFKQGVSLTIPNHAKPRLYERVRSLLRAEKSYLVVLGTLVLAVAANSYELLCTAGFPMVFTRALTLQELPTAAYYGYLVFYNLIYVVPLFIIVVIFVISLGSRKLTESEGRVLKLLSGTMMLELGVILITSPDALNNPMIAVILLVVAVVVTGLLVSTRKYLAPVHGRKGSAPGE